MKNIDYKLFFTVVLLIIFGVITISSVSVYSSFDVTNKMFLKGTIPEPYNYFYLLRSISHVIISLIILGIITKINPRFFERFGTHFLGFSAILLIITLLTTEAIKGAKGWLIIPGFPFVIQPTEFLKIFFIVFLAMMFKKYFHLLKDFQKGFIPYLIAIFGLVIIVGLIPDFGTLLVLIPVTGIMFFYAGANKKHITSLFALGILLFATVYSIGKYNPENRKDPNTNNQLGYIKERIDNYFKSSKTLFEIPTDPNSDNRTHQTKQGLITIGSGGVWGKGFGQSIQKFGYLPEVQGDFIFAVIIEEFGLRGILLLLAYLYIGYRGFYIAYHVKDKFEKFTAVGITSLILWQTFVNIGVNLNVVPLTGVTLPFISYGGSSLLSLCIGVGILLAISRNVEEKPQYSRMSKQRFIF